MTVLRGYLVLGLFAIFFHNSYSDTVVRAGFSARSETWIDRQWFTR